MKEARKLRGGFTLIELLTVIAIIAILAAIIFPVFGTLRRNVSKTSCLTNLHSIAQAVKMYKDDYRVFPEALYGYAVSVAGNVPVTRTFLYPQYVKERTGFRCPLNPERTTETTAAKLLPGINGVTGASTGLMFYNWDSYDGTRIPHNQANSPYVVHYLRRWDAKKIGVGEGESPRQLIYRYPPDTTVITWCTYHRNYDGANAIESGSVDLALFLDGRAKPVPANLMAAEAQAHLVTPGI
jgi:prepilin-type N-terminal cleavage/methylation domain-containing protein